MINRFTFVLNSFFKSHRNVVRLDFFLTFFARDVTAGYMQLTLWIIDGLGRVFPI